MIDKNNPLPDSTFDAGIICMMFEQSLKDPADENEAVMKEIYRLMGAEDNTQFARLLKAFALGFNKGLEFAAAFNEKHPAADPAQTN